MKIRWSILSSNIYRTTRTLCWHKRYALMPRVMRTHEICNGPKELVWLDYYWVLRRVDSDGDNRSSLQVSRYPEARLFEESFSDELVRSLHTQYGIHLNGIMYDIPVKIPKFDDKDVNTAVLDCFMEWLKDYDPDGSNPPRKK